MRDGDLRDQSLTSQDLRYGLAEPRATAPGARHGRRSATESTHSVIHTHWPSISTSNTAAFIPYNLNPDKSNPARPKHISLRSILIFSFHLHLVLSRVTFSLQALQSNFIRPLSGACPAHLTLLDLIVIILGAEYKLWLSSTCSFLQTPVASSLLDPNISLITLFPNNLNLRSFLRSCSSRVVLLC
jgi:hypothetical protein